MKKVLVVLLVFVFLAGCTSVEEVEKGDYKPGMYVGFDVVEGERGNVATAVIFVDENGFVADVFLDTTYMKYDIPHTKQALGDDYAMRVASPIEKEWFEQADLLALKVVEEQNLDFVNWIDLDETVLDTVAGVTMRVASLYKAIEMALDEAK